jgi:nitrate reductase gamma subunit
MNGFIPLLYAFFVEKLPYVTIAVFSIGMILRLQRWLGAPKDPTTLKPSLVYSLKYIFLDVVLFRKTFERDKGTWLVLFLFHGCIAGILFGHMRGFYLWSASMFDPLGHWFADFMVHTLPIYVGWVFIITQILLLVRRYHLEGKQLTSMTTDYVTLVLLLVTSIVGQGMRIFPPEAVPAEVYDIVFIPGLIVLHLEAVPSYHWFYIHILMTQLLVMYAPYSKLIHTISGVVAPAIYGSWRKQHDI